MSGGIAQFNDLLATLLAIQQYPDGYDERSLRDLHDQLDPATASIDPALADKLADIAGKLDNTSFADKARAARDELGFMTRIEDPAGAAARSRSGVMGSQRPGVSVPDTQTIQSPQFTFDVHVDGEDLTTIHKVADPDEKKTTDERMHDFIQWVMDLHALRSDENPIFFGLNHFFYWQALIKRDAPAYLATRRAATEAIFESGRILFARFQERPTDKEKVEKRLREIADMAKVTIAVRRPTANEWWRPVWEKAVWVSGSPNVPKSDIKTPEHQDTRTKLVSAIIQQVMKADKALADEWLEELAAKSKEYFRLSERVRDMAQIPLTPPLSKGDANRYCPHLLPPRPPRG